MGDPSQYSEISEWWGGAGVLTFGQFDPATTAWVAQVVANGGTVSAVEKGYVDTLIRGLKTDGLFSKLDRLWLFASENTFQALVDIIADATATAVNSPTFTANRGYTGNASNMQVDSNFNPTTATNPNFVQNSACLFAWNNTSGASSTPWIAGYNAAGGNSQITPYFTDTNDYWNINANNLSSAGTGATGLYLANRIAAGTETFDVNGSQSSSLNQNSQAPTNADLSALLADTSHFGNRQCSCMGFGGGLSSTDRSNIYTRLRTYMTAVGVP